ncbi:MAG: zinc-ribbon domain-containing protein [Xanthobacteraceae bacterium]|nr:zinc-ribbon domain-containing protein [Xanthobacteraceae bacterium]
MHLVCPSCDTAFLVDPAALGEAGRSVRCARCRTTWFAEPLRAIEPALADAMTTGDAAMKQPASAKPPAVLPEVVAWDDTVVVDIDSGPPLAPGSLRGEESPARKTPEHDETAVMRQRSMERKAHAKKRQGRSRLAAVTIILAAVVVGALGSRSTVVRAVPDLAGLYAAVGLPVNLRGLEFSNVKTTREMQDGIPVLVIAGEVVNVTGHPVELPRLRLGVLGPGNRELYSWTALLPRSILSDGEKISFRSRLASPPAEGREVLVRFLNRSDLTSGTR